MQFTFSILFSIFCFPSFAQIQNYQPDTLREKAQAALKLKFIESIKVEGKATASQSFLEHFNASIVPHLNRFTDIDSRQSVYNVLIDSASYKNGEQKTEFSNALEKANEELSAYQVDQKISSDFAQSAQLVGDLKGELADFSRRQARERLLTGFPKDSEAALTELQNLEARYQAALNEVPANAEFEKLTRGLLQLRQRFSKKEIPLKKAQSLSDGLLTEAGDHRIGFQAVNKTGVDVLNRMAVLRSQLAKAKGFPTWAQYKMEINGQGYDPQFRGAKNQRSFLKGHLGKMSARLRGWIEERQRELGATGVKLLAHHLGFLSRPDLSQLQPYFQDPTFVWQKTILESGFKPEVLRQIIIDDQPRTGKYGGGAFMLPILGAVSGDLRVDAETLDLVSSKNQRAGLVYVLQNYRNAGVRDLKTIFHEGMHALNFLLSGQTLPASETYGYLETPSTAAEHFTRDVDILFHNMKGTGDLPSRAEVETLVANQLKNDAINLYTNAENALFDLDLWDYDYAAPKAKTFMRRVQEIDADLFRFTRMPPSLTMKEPYWYARLSTDHFVFGKVQYAGYVYADVAARMVVDHVSQELERTTGRRSWYKQPGLAAIFTRELFEKGWRTTFPASIERMTNQSFL